MIGNFLEMRGLSAPTSKVLPFLLLLLLISTGCPGPWEAYQEIELGKPIPDDSIIVKKGVLDGHNAGIWEFNMLPFPAFAGYSWATSYEVEGKTIKKEYLAMAYGDWIFFQTGRIRIVTECLLPSSVQDPVKDWQYSDGVSKDTWSEFHNAAEYLFHSPSNESIDFDSALNYEPTEIFPLTFMILHPINVKITYMGHAEMVFFLNNTGGNMLAGLSHEGFELHYTDSYGSYVRIRNLGKGKLRMEMSWPCICEPPLLFLCLNDSFLERLSYEMENNSGVWKVRHGKGMPVKTYRRSLKKERKKVEVKRESETTIKDNQNRNPASK